VEAILPFAEMDAEADRPGGAEGRGGGAGARPSVGSDQLADPAYPADPDPREDRSDRPDRPDRTVPIPATTRGEL
jgi:hypothetical protein